MDYRFLAKKSLDRLFEETDLSVGEIIRTLTQEKLTGLKAENRSILTSVPDKEWYNRIEKVATAETEEDKAPTNEEWDTFLTDKK